MPSWHRIGGRGCVMMASGAKRGKGRTRQTLKSVPISETEKCKFPRLTIAKDDKIMKISHSPYEDKLNLKEKKRKTIKGLNIIKGSPSSLVQPTLGKTYRVVKLKHGPYREHIEGACLEPVLELKNSPVQETDFDSDWSMAEKENEISHASASSGGSSGEGRTFAPHDGLANNVADGHLWPVIGRACLSDVTAERSRALEQYIIEEITQEHEDMMQVLSDYQLKLDAALTFWKRNPADLVSYLFRVRDLSVAANCIGIITKSLKENRELQPLGACVELLPLIDALLNSRYEHYNLTALEWLEAVLKQWKTVLSVDTNGRDNQVYFDERNALHLREWLHTMTEQVDKLASLPGDTGKAAKEIFTSLKEEL
ncbi:KATNB1-like protein 1 isoform X2 [Lampetra planeri]